VIDIRSKCPNRTILEYSETYPLKHEQNLLPNKRIPLETARGGLESARWGHAGLEKSHD
jgi:hypothetical protein